MIGGPVGAWQRNLQTAKEAAMTGRWNGLIACTLVALAAGLTTSQGRGAGPDDVLLRYRFRQGDVIRWKVVHLATTETTIKEQTELSRTRSVAVKAWKVIDVDASGRATIEHVVERVEMWQKVSDHPEVRYDSTKDKTPPPEYVTVAETIGKPLVRAVVTPRGKELQRNRPKKPFDLGLGGFVIPFPKDRVAVGSSWYVPRTIRVQIPDGLVKQIKVRQRYTLQRVRHGVATIAVKTEVITPVTDPRIEMQLIQDLVHGTIRFDIDKGQVISREVDWDDTVVEFAGPSSMIKYRARLTEERESDTPRTADASAP